MLRANQLELRPEPETLGPARECLRQWFAERNTPPQVVGDAELVATELITNALLHARPPLTLSAVFSTGSVRIAVTDHAPGSLPVMRDYEPGRIGGWGMIIVSSLAIDSGVTTTATDKTVWADLALDER